jgi:membrane protein YdbS with pleckstrin-like domain
MSKYMNSIDNKPTTNEPIMYRAQLHWAILLGPVLVILIGALALKSQGYHAIALIVFGLIWGIFSYVRLRRSEIGLSRNKILINIGFPLKKSFEIPLNEIIFIDHYQPTLGSMLNFGKILVMDKRKKKYAFRFVAGPADLVKEVHHQINALSSSSTAQLQ